MKFFRRQNIITIVLTLFVASSFVTFVSPLFASEITGTKLILSKQTIGDPTQKFAIADSNFIEGGHMQVPNIDAMLGLAVAGIPGYTTTSTTMVYVSNERRKVGMLVTALDNSYPTDGSGKPATYRLVHNEFTCGVPLAEDNRTADGLSSACDTTQLSDWQLVIPAIATSTIGKFLTTTDGNNISWGTLSAGSGFTISGVGITDASTTLGLSISSGLTGSFTYSTSTIALDLTHANEWSGLQTFDSGMFALKGLTSGTVKLLAATSTADYSLTLPDSLPSTYGFMLSSDVSGTLSWNPHLQLDNPNQQYKIGELTSTGTKLVVDNLNQTIQLNGTQVVKTNTISYGTTHDYTSGMNGEYDLELSTGTGSTTINLPSASSSFVGEEVRFTDLDNLIGTSTTNVLFDAGSSNTITRAGGAPAQTLLLNTVAYQGSRIIFIQTGNTGTVTNWQATIIKNSAGGGTIGGTIASTQIGYGTGPDVIGGTSDFTYDTSGVTPLFNVGLAGNSFLQLDNVNQQYKLGELTSTGTKLVVDNLAQTITLNGTQVVKTNTIPYGATYDYTSGMIGEYDFEFHGFSGATTVDLPNASSSYIGEEVRFTDSDNLIGTSTTSFLFDAGSLNTITAAGFSPSQTLNLSTLIYQGARIIFIETGNSGGVTNWQATIIKNVSGTIGGTISAGQVAFGTSTDTIAGTNNFLFTDGINPFFSVGDLTPGSGGNGTALTLDDTTRQISATGTISLISPSVASGPVMTGGPEMSFSGTYVGSVPDVITVDIDSVNTQTIHYSTSTGILVGLVNNGLGGVSGNVVSDDGLGTLIVSSVTGGSFAMSDVITDGTNSLTVDTSASALYDTYAWSDSATSYSSSTNSLDGLASVPILLGSTGVSVVFNASVGNTNGETWTYTMSASAISPAFTISDVLGNNYFVVNAVANNSNFFGVLAGQGATNAFSSNFFGVLAGQGATNAFSSNFFGLDAGMSATNADHSNFLGVSAGAGATNAVDSNFFGVGAGMGATNADDSNFFGLQAGQGATNAANSNFIGNLAGNNAANANNSIFIGNKAGVSDSVDNTAGGTSILIGQNTGTGGNSNSVAIGYGAHNTAANQFLIDAPNSPFTDIALNSGAGVFRVGDINNSSNQTALYLDDGNMSGNFYGAYNHDSGTTCLGTSGPCVLDDIIISGAQTTGKTTTYTVTVTDTSGPQDIVDFTDGVTDIPGLILPAALPINGIIFNPGSPTGHTVGDTWTMTVSSGQDTMLGYNAATRQSWLGDQDWSGNNTTVITDDLKQTIQLNGTQVVKTSNVNYGTTYDYTSGMAGEYDLEFDSGSGPTTILLPNATSSFVGEEIRFTDVLNSIGTGGTTLDFDAGAGGSLISSVGSSTSEFLNLDTSVYKGARVVFTEVKNDGVSIAHWKATITSGGSGTMTLAPNQVGFASTTGDLIGTNNFLFNDNGINPFFQVGDLTGSGNGTQLILQDLNRTVNINGKINIIGGLSSTTCRGGPCISTDDITIGGTYTGTSTATFTVRFGHSKHQYITVSDISGFSTGTIINSLGGNNGKVEAIIPGIYPGGTLLINTTSGDFFGSTSLMAPYNTVVLSYISPLADTVNFDDGTTFLPAAVLISGASPVYPLGVQTSIDGISYTATTTHRGNPGERWVASITTVHATDTALSLDFANRLYTIGDTLEAGNKTKIVVDDTIKKINFNGNYSFPFADGTSGQVLKTDGAGNISWGLGGSITLGANQVGFASTTGDLIGTNNFLFNDNGINPFFQVGDLTGSGNGTQFSVDDSSKLVRVKGTSNIYTYNIGSTSCVSVCTPDDITISGSYTGSGLPHFDVSLMANKRQYITIDNITGFSGGDSISFGANNGTIVLPEVEGVIPSPGASPQGTLWVTVAGMSDFTGATTVTNGTVTSTVISTYPIGDSFLFTGDGNAFRVGLQPGASPIYPPGVQHSIEGVTFTAPTSVLHTSGHWTATVLSSVSTSTATTTALNLDFVNNLAQVGDVFNQRNGDLLSINNASNTNKFFNHYTGVLDNTLSLDGNTGIFSIGDLGNVLNGTKISINDLTKKITFNNNYSFPFADGTPGQVLKTDGSGSVSWNNTATGTIGGTINSGQIAFSTSTNNIGGSNDFQFIDGPYPLFKISGGYGANFAVNETSGVVTATGSLLLNSDPGDGIFSIKNGANTYFTVNARPDSVSSNFLGTNAGSDSFMSSYSNFMGDNAGQNSTYGYYDNFFGENAGYAAYESQYDNFFGFQSGMNAITTEYSNFFGVNAGNGVNDVKNSNFFGQHTGEFTSVKNSNFFGSFAGYQATNASSSNFFGLNAGYQASNANNSIFLGSYSGYNDTTLDNSVGGKTSILIGDNTHTGGFSDSVAIGNGAVNTAANQFLVRATSTHAFTDIALDSSTGTIRFGDLLGAGSSTKIVINDSTHQITFNGSYSFPYSDGASGQILKTTGTGSIYWATSTSGIGGTVGTNQVAFGVATDTLLGTENFKFINTAHPLFKVGDYLGSGSSTQFSLDDSAQLISATGIFALTNVVSTGAFSISSGGNNYFTVNAVSNNSNFIGAGAGVGSTITTGSNFIGQNAGNGASHSFSSNFFGQYAGQGSTWSSNSNFLGVYAGHNAFDANDSNFFGREAGANATLSNFSNFFGDFAGINATYANHSNFFGANAGQNTNYANNSTFIGMNSGLNDIVNNSTGGKTSILIGDNTNTGGNSDSVAIGNGAVNTAANQFLVRATSTHSFTDIALDSSTGTTRLGDLLNTGSSTKFILNDSSKSSAFYTNNFTISDNASTTKKFFNIDTTAVSGSIALGDIDNLHNSGVFGISTMDNTWSASLTDQSGSYGYFNVSPNSRSYYLGDFNTHYGGTVIAIDDTVGMTSTSQSVLMRANSLQLTIPSATSSVFTISDGSNNYFTVNAIANNSTFIGTNAGVGSTGSGSSNFFGQNAGQGAVNASADNFFGLNAGLGAHDSFSNNFFGFNAGSGATSTTYSNFFGDQAGLGASSTHSNFFGFGAGASDIVNSSNFFGNSAGSNAIYASYSNFLGSYAGADAPNASSSNFFGHWSGEHATNAFNSTFIGYNTGYYATSSNNSIFIGNNAGLNDTVNNSTSSRTSILIGDNTNTGGFSDSVAIGNGAVNTVANQFLVSSTGTHSFADMTFVLASGTSTGGVFNIQDNNSSANKFFSINIPSDSYSFGDLTGMNNHSYIKIDDNNSGSATTGLIIMNHSTLSVNDAVHTCTFDPSTSTGGFTCTSDQRLKTNINNLPDTLAQINSLRPVTYNWISSGTSSDLRTGFIAQEMQKVFPQFVSVVDTQNGYLGIDYGALTVPIVKAIQEMDLKLEPLTSLDVTQDGSLASLIKKYLEDALNGIQVVFAGKVQTKELCLDDLCVTKTELQKMMNQASVQGAMLMVPPSITSTTTATTTDASSTAVSTSTSLFVLPVVSTTGISSATESTTTSTSTAIDASTLISTSTSVITTPTTTDVLPSPSFDTTVSDAPFTTTTTQ